MHMPSISFQLLQSSKEGPAQSRPRGIREGLVANAVRKFHQRRNQRLHLGIWRWGPSGCSFDVPRGILFCSCYVSGNSWFCGEGGERPNQVWRKRLTPTQPYFWKSPGGCQWAQKVKQSGLASLVAKNGTPRVISQISWLKFECTCKVCRGISGLHFCFSKNFWTMLLEAR